MPLPNQKSLLVTGIAALITMAIFFSLTFASSPAKGFFPRRAAVYANLRKQIETAPPGVTTRLPPSLETLRKTPTSIDESHIRRVVQHGDWNGVCNFSLYLDLDEIALPAGEQGSSETMAAAKLLKHYFGGLARQGLAGRSRSCVLGSLQSASEAWVSDDELLFVEGTVFVSPAEKQAIVTGVVRERLPQE